MNSTTSDRAAFATYLSILQERWGNAFGHGQNQSTENATFFEHDFGRDNSSAEFRSLMDVLDAGRRRILSNRFLRVWIGWSCWIFVGLIVAAAFLAKLIGVVILAGVLLVAGAAAAFAWVWRNQPSLYYAACRLDAAAGLKDRMSTALCFGEAANPGGMILRQRQDALNRVSQMDARQMFPIRTPTVARHALLLAVLAGGMLLYRVYYQPPMMAFLRASARSHLLQTAAANRDAGEDQRAVESTPQDFWKKTASVNENAQSDFQGEPSSEKGADTQEKGQSSLAESLMQTLKNLTSHDSDQQAPANGANQQQSSRKDSPPGEKSSEPNQSSDGGAPDQSQSQSDGQHISPGAGDKLRDPQPVAKNTLKSSDPSVKAVPDRVALPSANVKDQPRTRSSPETGAAQVAVRNVSARSLTVINGGEQDDIPARYRLYVQRYFEHEDTKQK